MSAENVLLTGENLREKVHEANIAVHRLEAVCYELLHPEVYGKQEQKRINATLKIVDKLVVDNHKVALDFGAGTGNLTGKLLRMGYKVTAIDISAEMCTILKKKYNPYLDAERLIVINSPIEDVNFEEGEFDLITCYSVLHHLPDYASTLQRLTVFLKKGGVMYLDHEASPFYWKGEPSVMANLVKNLYFHSNPLINVLHFRIIGLKVPNFDYSLSDYWHRNDHPLNHKKIERIFERAGFDFFQRVDYQLKRTWVWNPLFFIYRYTCSSEMSFYVAKK